MQKETILYNRLKATGNKSPLFLYVQTVNRKPSHENQRALYAAIVDQWHHNPDYMDRMLGFDLQKLLKMKLYTVDSLNRELSNMNYAFRIIESTTATSKMARWTARADYFSLQDGTGTIYIDNLLNRYIRLSNGQMFACTNADLLGMPKIDRENILAYLTGLID